MEGLIDNKPTPYQIDLRNKYPGISDIEIERSILRAWRREWSENPESCPYHHTDRFSFDASLPEDSTSGWAQHLLRYQALIMPKVGINPWLIKMHKAIEKTVFFEKRKIANFIGSKNSGKTSYFALFCHLMVSIDPQFTRSFISGPYKNAADATIWGRVGTRFSLMKEANPKLWENAYETKGQFVYDANSSEAGYIELITLDKVGKLQGTKSLDPNRGWLILICDEIAEFPTAAALDALDNLTGNANFICLTGCNFKNIEGLEGKLCAPEGREYAELNIDEDEWWLSAYKSVTFRFDGHKSPNILAGKILYPYLLTPTARADMEDVHGLKGPKYLEQIRSFPNSSMSDYYVTTRDKIRGAGGYAEVVWDIGTPTKVAFCDPGFGGDPCVFGAFKFGPARVQAADGNWHSVQVFEPICPMEIIKMEVGRIADDDWMNRVSSIATGEVLIQHGAIITIEQQIAVACAELLSKHGISRTNFGYDGSMRAGIVHEMVVILGSGIHSMDFGGEATDRIIDSVGRTAKEEFYNFVTEMHFNMCATIQAGQFRGAALVETAIGQLVRRPWKHAGQKKQIQPKIDYKKFNQGRSPDHSDVLIGAHEIAMRSGFRTNLKRTATSASATLSTRSFIDQIKELGICRQKTAASLRR